MEDLCAFPQSAPKAPRVCCAPLCGKPLAGLNKRELCFTCQNRQLFQGTTVNGTAPWVYGSRRR